MDRVRLGQAIALRCGGNLLRSADGPIKTWDFVKPDGSQMSLTEAEFNKACVTLKWFGSGCCLTRRHPATTMSAMSQTWVVGLGPVMSDGREGKYQKCLCMERGKLYMRTYEKLRRQRHRLETLLMDQAAPKDYKSGRLLWEMRLSKRADVCAITNFRRLVLAFEENYRRLCVLKRRHLSTTAKRQRP